MKGFLEKIAFPCLIAFMLIGSWGCGNGADPTNGVLSRDDMVRIMAEVYVTEEKVGRLGLRQDSAVEVFEGLKMRFFSDLGVRDSVFQKSLEYYAARPEEMQKLYEILVDSLQLREQRAPVHVNR